ncbi:hypothetical protein JI667_07745 [Bacillus sp. NTK074B]|uniref:hypothetical protein n=1 Tax=Bacillus sp. NTK074B TaxID=2802174 RepID=UPI001A8E5461|nr:hypothetical protein [Bacillus sp. NTK074B]
MMITGMIAVTTTSVVTGINSCLGTEGDATYLVRMMIAEDVAAAGTTSEGQDAEAEEATKIIAKDADAKDISAAAVAADFSGKSSGTPC